VCKKRKRKKKHRESKKLTGRVGGQANREQYKQTHKKNSRFRNNRISVFIVLVLPLQLESWCWYLSKSSVF
jgi:hypothetical protein